MPKTSVPACVFRAWDPNFDYDPIVKLEKSKFAIIKPIGEARRTILVNELMKPIPWLAYLAFLVISSSAFIAYFIAIAICTVRGTRSDEVAVYTSTGIFAFTSFCWLAFCWYYRSYISSVPETLALPPWQHARRGSLLQDTNISGGASSRSEKGRKVPGSILRSSTSILRIRNAQVHLTDVGLRSTMYGIRFCLQVLALILSAVGHFLGGHIEGPLALVLSLLPHVMSAYLLLEMLMTCTVGTKWTLSFQLAKRIYYKRRAYEAAPFVPFDPRAIGVQNYFLASILAFPTMATLSILFDEGFEAGCLGLHVLPVLSSLCIMLIYQVGAKYSFCPFTVCVGCLVARGVLAKPLGCSSEAKKKRFFF